MYRHATTPTVKIGINIFEDVRSLAKGSQTIGGIEHQWFISGKKPKTVFYHLTDTQGFYRLLNWSIIAQPSPFSFPKKALHHSLSRAL